MSLSRFDTDAIENGTDLVALVGHSIALKHKGREWVGLCPFHDDSTPSFAVNPAQRKWRCRACGVWGGAIDWQIQYKGMDFIAACKSLTVGDFSSSVQLPASSLLPKVKDGNPPAVLDIPADAMAARPVHRKVKNKAGVWDNWPPPNKTWVYKDANGRGIYWVHRWDQLNQDGSPVLNSTGKPAKEFSPQYFSTKGWKWLTMPPLWPIYGLDRLAARPDLGVLVVEGEKVADYAAERLSGSVPVSWPGGTNTVRYVDWSPVAGRRVLLCRDNDFGGWGAMEWLGHHLIGLGCEVFWVEPLAGVVKGWDIADSGWPADELLKFIKCRVPFADRGECPHEAPARSAGPAKPAAAPAGEAAKTAADQAKPSALPALPAGPAASKQGGTNDPFIHLGYEKTAGGDVLFWYYVKARQLTLSLSAGKMGMSGFLTLAPLQWWEAGFPARGGKIDTVMAQNMLIQKGNEVGLFDARRIRGRGAWMDAGRVVVHAGDHLIVNGRGLDLDLDSHYIYEQRQNMGFDLVAPMKKSDSAKFLEICKRLNWDVPVSAYLLAGWVVIAPICGIFKWRPHIWVVGSKGTGKSTIMNGLVARMLGKSKLFVEGLSTTEAGLRQTLDCDALPVVFDEAEANTPRAREALGMILSLVRSMSSDSESGIVKGSGAGVAKSYNLRSCFAFSSIGLGTEQASDKSRMSVLSLHASRAADAISKWEETSKLMAGLISDEYVDAFQSRTIAMVSVIAENTAVFGRAVRSVLGDQRLGDQLGPLLAGAYSLSSDKVITNADALTWVGQHGWVEEKEMGTSRDEARLMDTLLDRLLRFPVNGQVIERTVAELMLQVVHERSTTGPSRAIADEELRRHGFRVEDGRLCVANSHEEVRLMLRDTGWVSNYSMMLLRLDGAVAAGPIGFAGRKCRAVSIPLESCGLADIVPVVDGVENDLPF